MSEQNDLTIAERLKVLRKEHQKTQKDVATALDIPPEAYQKYEYGQRIPVVSKLCQLADYFNVTTDYLLGRTDKLK